MVECKSEYSKEESLKKWAERIAELETSVESYTRVANRIIAEGSNPTQTQTRPIRILCCLNNNKVNMKLDNNEQLFDVIIRAPHPEATSLEIEFAEKHKTLYDWYLALNHAGGQKKVDAEGEEELEKIKLEDYAVEGVSLLSFNLQLNQLLMLINNPIPFPHMAYARMFNNHGKGGKTHE